MEPMPEITAAHVLAVLSPTAPPGVVVAIEHAEHRILVCPAADTTDWRRRVTATVVATRAEIVSALAPDEH
ncbi:hypothetical protein ACFQZ2_23020, partial [Streptomonospora algeriensis]